MTFHAIVIGSGPNGLVAANVLADHGWNVAVLEANDDPGGAVRSAELTVPGFLHDCFSAFYPLAAASPTMTSLALERHGLRWCHAPAVLAHPRRDRRAAVLHRGLDATVAGLECDHAGDGHAFARLQAEWSSVGAPFLASMLSPFPPLRAGARLAMASGVQGLRSLARRSLVPLRRFVEEEFGGESAGLLYAGAALHADLTPESAGSALLGWLLVSVGQEVGFPVPVGGAQTLTRALVTRFVERGGVVRCGARVERVIVRNGRAVGVEIAGVGAIAASRAVIADCDATKLYLDLVGAEHLPAALLASLRRVQRSSSTFKIDWALSGPVPWTDPSVVGAGAVHIADDLDELSFTAAQLASGFVPDRPFVLLGQMTTADPTRSPPGTETVWAYTHVPQRIRGDAAGDGVGGEWNSSDVERFTDRVERRIEALAPGFGSRVIARHVASPSDLEAANANLVGGDISGGTAQLHQQLILRPVPGLGRASTPVRRLYLGSASAHPGGAVHGACGANAASAALAHHRTCDFTRRRRH